MQAQIVIKELSEITENKSTNSGDSDNKKTFSDDAQSKDYIENKTVEVILLITF